MILRYKKKNIGITLYAETSFLSSSLGFDLILRFSVTFVGGGGFRQQQTQSRPQSRPQSSGNFGGSNSNSGECRFTGCQGVRDSVRVYPDPNNSFGFIQCDGNGRAVRQQCNGIRFNLQTCNWPDSKRINSFYN